MLSIQQKSSSAQKTTPNLVPCRIDHNGPVNATERYWKPQTENDGTQTAFFRGRKLKGRQLQLPDGYRGALLSTTNRTLLQDDTQAGGEGDDSEEDEETVEVRVVEEVGHFDRVVVWGHESVPDEAEDSYSRGLTEWLTFAQAMHSQPKRDNGSQP
ncbi:ribonuclease H2, subunit C [Phyllosticta citrichinensis]|uniref:Ribonuclease H2, subunit C n=1 Tax=Phyllosticta citrichinensis TaxID=1130410 RepID=A0ABR1XPP1_9PEZI